MLKIIIVKNDIKLGPQPILQFPPDRDFPENEIFLRIWAHHEMDSDKNVIELHSDKNEENSKKFLSVFFNHQKKRLLPS